MIHAKICGITSLEDAQCAVKAGAHLVGFIFAPSPRRADPAVAASICRVLPPGVERVGVFVDKDAARIREVARAVGLTMVQLNGDKTAGMEDEMELPVIRALGVTSVEEAVERARATRAPYLLIEPRVAGLAGGTGRTLDTAVAAGIITALADRRVFLAGGLGPDNVRELVRAVRPYGVDAASRLESAPGRKDHGLVKQFLEAVRT